MHRSTDHPWLTRYAVAVAVATFFLICVGGVVTSKGVGMSVPDWPTTYGYNMFFFPVSKWVGGVFYEHSHRLVASLVGLMTVILAVWLQLRESRRWLRRLGWLALVLVVAQGVLGGMRVEAMKDELGIFHATLAQGFFVLVSLMALFLSRAWQERPSNSAIYDSGPLRYVMAFATAMIFVQLILGATMRHEHAGLAIPDFPMAYGSWWPATDPDSVARYNSLRTEETALNPITGAQVNLQMAHRLGAVAILGFVAWATVLIRRAGGGLGRWGRLGPVWLGLVLVQAGLGAVTIWTNKSADIATAHVGVGALVLLTGMVLCVVTASRVREAELKAAAGALAEAGREEMGMPA